MAIVQTLNKTQFVNAFDEAGRGNRFSYEAREMLFEHYEQLSDDIGEPIEMDVIEICSGWHEVSEYELLDIYSDLFADIEDEDERLDKIIEWLASQTTVYTIADKVFPYHNYLIMDF